ncbi:MAG TPA: type II toxin-antitoxin system VapC family toxin, partial [Gammaproteobacteria bacterium]|nr:type II toxin-antitoxin system VapC family toxin [Gammaproteobacteria bacterium]
SIFNTQEVFISDTVILETEWVLRYAYEFSPEEICNALVKLFGLRNIYLSNPAFIAQAIEWHKKGVDFSDALHLTQCQRYEKLYTFDKKFSSKAKNLTDCSVVLP